MLPLYRADDIRPYNHAPTYPAFPFGEGGICEANDGRGGRGAQTGGYGIRPYGVAQTTAAPSDEGAVKCVAFD